MQQDSPVPIQISVGDKTREQLIRDLNEVMMTDEYRKKIEETMAVKTCPSDFKFTEEGFEHLCKTREIGQDGRKRLICEEDREKQKACKFADWFGGSSAQPYGYFCTCPPRLYLSEKLKK